MRRPFLRVYVGVVLVVLAVQAVTLFQMQRTIAEEADRRVVAALAPGVHLMQRRLGRHRGPIPERIIEEVAAHHGLGSTLRRTTDAEYDLTSSEEAQIRSEELALIQRGSARYIYTELRPGVYLSLGPMEDLVPSRGIVARLAQTGLVLLLIGGVLFLLLSPFERRLARLAIAARALGEGEMDARVTDSKEDAIGEVSKAFDAMAQRVGDTIEDQRDLLRAVSHELRTPVARLFFLVDEVRGAEESDERNAKLDRFDASLEEMRVLVDELLIFSRISDRSGLGSTACTPIAPLISECVSRAGELRGDIELQTNVGEVDIHCSPRLVERAVTNLLSNAVRHAISRVHVSAEQIDSLLIITVSDDGSGIARGDRQRVLEPFTRLDESRQRDAGGAGLGLAIVSRIAAAHDGTLAIGESELGGASVALRLPVDGPDES